MFVVGKNAYISHNRVFTTTNAPPHGSLVAKAKRPLAPLDSVSIRKGLSIRWLSLVIPDSSPIISRSAISLS